MWGRAGRVVRAVVAGIVVAVVAFAPAPAPALTQGPARAGPVELAAADDYDTWCQTAGVCRRLRSSYIGETKGNGAYGNGDGAIGRFGIVLRINLNGRQPRYTLTLIHQEGPPVQFLRLHIDCRESVDLLPDTDCGSVDAGGPLVDGRWTRLTSGSDPDEWEIMIDWDAVPIADPPAPRPGAPLDVDGSRYFAVPEMGFGMLVAALAGSGNLVRTAGTTRPPVVVTETRGGVTTRRVEDRTPEDDEAVEEDITSYLDEADIAPPPRGYTWFLRVPARCRTVDEVFRLVNGHLRGSTALRAGDIRDEIEPVVRGLYAEPGPAGAAG